jgi:hypothetical protein
MSDSFKTSINPLDIKYQIQQVIKFSDRMFKQFLNMLTTMKFLIKKLVFSILTHVHIFFVISSILIIGTILFSKNKLGNLLVLCYICIIIFISGLLLGVLGLIINIIEKIITLIKKIIDLANQKKEVDWKPIFYLIIAIIYIFILIFEIFFMVCFLILITLFIDILFGIAIKIFDIINGLYAGTSIVAQTTMGALDTFGSMVRKGFENC